MECAEGVEGVVPLLIMGSDQQEHLDVSTWK
jgi:hypothetical protein